MASLICYTCGCDTEPYGNNGFCRYHYFTLRRLNNPQEGRDECKRRYLRKGKDWNTDRCRKYRQTQEGKQAVKRTSEKYIKNNKDRVLAWRLAKQLPLNTPCVICGDIPTHRHHPDYNKPFDIIYLCPLHHKGLHIGKNML